MGHRQRFRKKKEQRVVAVQLDLDTTGFTYRKWGGEQTCRRGDWLVHNGADTYTIFKDSFAATYRKVSRGIYQKVTPVWAEQVTTAGSIETHEGITAYQAGDYVVSNNEDGTDGYAISQDRFESLYVPDS